MSTEIVVAEAEPIVTPESSPLGIYMLTLTTKASRDSMFAAVKSVSKLLGYVDPWTAPWERIDYAVMSALKSKLAAKYAPATGNRYMAAVRGILKQCWRLGLMTIEEYHRARDTGPIKGSRLPKGRALEREEIRTLLGSVRMDRVLGARDRALLALLFSAGLRRSEAVGLDLAHLEGDKIRVTGKGNKQRLIPIGEAAMRAINAWLEVRGLEPGPLLLPTARMGKALAWRRMSAHAVLNIARTLAKRGDVAAWAPHDARRTYVSSLLDLSKDLATVQQLAGHSQPATTARYDRRGERAKVAAAALLKFPFEPGDSD